MQDTLPEDLLLEILLNAREINSVVVGGQALNLWAESLFHRAPKELEAFQPYVSKDIDFFGTAEEAESLASRLCENGRVRVFKSDGSNSASPNSAVIMLERDNKQYVIDFLYNVAMAGASNKPLSREIIDRAITLGDADRIQAKVMHPAPILRTRISGITLLKRSDDTAIRQLNAAPIVLREFIASQLDNGLHISDPEERRKVQKEATKDIKEMIAIGAQREANSVYRDHGVDVLAHASKLASHPFWPAKFAEQQLTIGIEKLRQKRERTLAEQERKASRLADDHSTKNNPPSPK